MYLLQVDDLIDFDLKVINVAYLDWTLFAYY